MALLTVQYLDLQDPEFKIQSICDQAVIQVRSDLNRLKYPNEDDIFDFKKNETLNIDRIVEAAIRNKGRSFYKQKFKNAYLDTRNDDPKSLIGKIDIAMPEIRE